MSETTTKKRRKSRKSKKEQEIINSINEEEKVQEEGQRQNTGEPIELYNNMSEEQSKKLMERSDIQEKMMDMDIRIKYGFIRTLHNNLLSINGRVNWSPEELMPMGMIFRDMNGIERTVFNQVMTNIENEDEEEEVEEEEVEEETPADVN